MPEAMRVNPLDLTHVDDTHRVSRLLLSAIDAAAGPICAAAFLPPAPNEVPAWALIYLRHPHLNDTPELVNHWSQAFRVAILTLPPDGPAELHPVACAFGLADDLTWRDAVTVWIDQVTR